MHLSQQTQIIQSFISTHPKVSELSIKEVEDFYIQLIDCLIDHNHLYYINAAPIISDKEYDDLFAYLKKIEEAHPELISSNSPTQGLIGQVSEGFEKAPHSTPLLSLENTYNAQDLRERDERAHKILEKNLLESSEISYIIEPKFDGLSVELIYKNGIFSQAITRGDGKVGEDITENVRTIKNIPKKLSRPITVSVRGEIMMPKSVRKEPNEERIQEGEIPFANTRNAAAGSIKLLDPKEVARRGLVCYLYDVLQGKEALNNIGLPMFPRTKQAKNMQEVITLCEDPVTKNYLEEQDIEFDGLVIKIQDKQQRELIGSTDHHPRRAVAYKFPAQLAATQILSVDYQVGRTGIITPVANLEPVQLSGAKLQRVSLHNFDFIRDKDIHLHDWIWLQRSGEVIPYIVSVISDRRTGQEIEILPPILCPSCNTPVVNEDMHYYCKNPHCPEKIKQQIQHFVSKPCMDILGTCESIVNILVDNNIITNIADIYKLDDPMIQIQLLKFPGFGDKKVAEIAKGIEESKHKALRRLLNGLGIGGIGKKTAQDIASHMNTSGVDALLQYMTDTQRLTDIYGVGTKTVENISQFFQNTNNLTVLKELESAGLNMDSQKYSDTINKDEAKGSFSITGTFPLSREKIAELLQAEGYLFHESPTKSTDCMLVGDKAGSKAAKAEEYGIEIIKGRETILTKFPSLNTIKQETKSPQVQSLFG